MLNWKKARQNPIEPHTECVLHVISNYGPHNGWADTADIIACLKANPDACSEVLDALEPPRGGSSFRDMEARAEKAERELSGVRRSCEKLFGTADTSALANAEVSIADAWEYAEKAEAFGAEMLAKSNDALARLRATAQTLIEATGADGPLNAEEAAARAVGQLSSARDARDAALVKLASAERVVEAVKAYAEENGGCDHHPDDCPGDEQYCRVVSELSAALRAHDSPESARCGASTGAVACRGCGQPLATPSPDLLLADGCPCNSRRGVNHGLVPVRVCTCAECDPAQTGAARPEPGPYGHVSKADECQVDEPCPECGNAKCHYPDHGNGPTAPPPLTRADVEEMIAALREEIAGACESVRNPYPNAPDVFSAPYADLAAAIRKGGAK